MAFKVRWMMTEEDTICDRTYRAHEREERKPDKPLTRSLPRHSKQDHKVRYSILNLNIAKCSKVKSFLK